MYNIFEIKGSFLYNNYVRDKVVSKRTQFFYMKAGKEKELLRAITSVQQFFENHSWVAFFAKQLKHKYLNIQFEITKKTFNQKNILLMDHGKQSFYFENVEHPEMERFFNELVL